MGARVLLLAMILGAVLAGLAAWLILSSDTLRSLPLGSFSWSMIGGGAIFFAAGLRLAVAPRPRRLRALAAG